MQAKPIPDDLTIGPPRFYNMRQAAQALGVTRQTLGRWVREGLVARVRIGRRYYIARDELYRLADL